jgi:hypothetical protein
MGRKSKEYLDKLKEKYSVDVLWSWSKYNSYKTDKYGWMLKYIRHEKETKTSIYGTSGGNVHDIVEKFYKKEITYEQMIEEYETKLFEMNMAELKYNRKDEKANEKIADKYEGCIRLFFQNHVPIEGKVITEQFVTIKVGNNIFQGYVDFINKDNEGNYIITDWKTSTLYVGKKVEKECGQLVLYAESLIQKGVPIDKIKIRWDFLKYCNIEYQLKGIDKETNLHKTKETKELRDRWVSKIANNLKMWLKEFEYDELEIEDIVQTSISNNNLDNVPSEIQNKYKLSDCYVYIPLTQEIINELKQNIIKTIDEIKQKEKDYLVYMEQGEIDKAEELFWTEIDKTNEFYFANLCGYSSKQHKPYKEYLDTLNLFVKQDNNEELSDDWLSDL